MHFCWNEYLIWGLKKFFQHVSFLRIKPTFILKIQFATEIENVDRLKLYLATNFIDLIDRYDM